MDINVKGVWYGCKYAILAMRKTGGGSIINTASFVAIMGAATPQLACKSRLGFTALEDSPPKQIPRRREPSSP